MKIFAIRDATDKKEKDLAFLLYFETDKRFFIELPENADPWETPLLLSSFAENEEHTVNSYWSKIWVQQRIVPPDRQNIRQILKENDLESYDEYDLLMLSCGRCEQDDYYLVPIREESLPSGVLRRFREKVEDVVALSEYRLLLFFRDGTARKCDFREYFQGRKRFTVLLSRPDYFQSVRVQTGGYGIQWDENLMIPYAELYRMGDPLPLSFSDLLTFVSARIIDTSEAAEILSCSRQYINELVKTDKLHPVKSSEKCTLFSKSEVLKRSWK